MRKVFILLFLIFAFSCREQTEKIIEPTIYIDYVNNQLEASTIECQQEITKDSSYLAQNFEEVNINGLIPRIKFNYTTLVIDGVRFQEIILYGCTNTNLTWYTQPYSYLCSFRHNLKTKTLSVFHLPSKQHIDFRSIQGRSYFKKCLSEL